MEGWEIRSVKEEEGLLPASWSEVRGHRSPVWLYLMPDA